MHKTAGMLMPQSLRCETFQAGEAGSQGFKVRHSLIPRQRVADARMMDQLLQRWHTYWAMAAGPLPWSAAIVAWCGYAHKNGGVGVCGVDWVVWCHQQSLSFPTCLQRNTQSWMLHEIAEVS